MQVIPFRRSRRMARWMVEALLAAILIPLLIAAFRLVFARGVL